ncbi:MAG: ATP-binding cassette domain-containing protein [Thermoproteales archaeon]|nr:ATP-binding cassette domain-containing protein [Thermoproteales archaeon]
MEKIKAENLRKIFITKERRGIFKGEKRKVEALKGISFAINKGEIFGLLGPNGAGKTTTIKILSTLLLPDDGDAWVNGYHVVKEANKVREIIGVSLYSDRGFYWKLTGYENLMYFAYLYHLNPEYAKKRIKYLLDILELSKDADRLVEEYSTGMKSKLNFARALIHDPEIIFLDEPTIGLDPNSARKIREIIRDLKKEGKTILLTTHNMYEADILCDRIAIINKGKIIALGTPNELKSVVEKDRVIEIQIYGILNGLTDKIRKINGVKRVGLIQEEKSLKNRIKVIMESDDVVPEVLRILVSEKIKVESIKSVEPSLEDVFVYLTGERLEKEE